MGDKRELQSKFTLCLGKLILYAFEQPNVELTLGEGYDDDNKGHMAGSLHYSRLAQDLNLFVAGEWIQGQHPMWLQLGTYWKSLDTLCRWGGDFKSRDFNHVSMEYGGRRLVD